MEGKNYPLPSHLAQKRQVALAQCQGAILQKVALANQRRMWTLIKSKVTSLKKKINRRNELICYKFVSQKVFKSHWASLQLETCSTFH